jgi:ribosomal protein S18 acetylase RimI-like enzyme
MAIVDDEISPAVVARRADIRDASALVRLRALMLAEMGMDTEAEGSAWQRTAHAWFESRLADTGSFAAFVVDDPVLGVVSGAAGMCDRHAPNPRNLSGVHGHVFNISTDPRCRRRGYATACLTSLLAWFGEETEARVINLNATGDGIGLYRSLGFAAPRYPALQLRLPAAAS